MRTYELPWPPSVNHYWRNLKTRTVISRKGREYREAVFAIVALREHQSLMSGRLAVYVTAYPPDKRRRDLDNILKALLDALEYAGVYEDDGQIDRIVIERKGGAKGVVLVGIEYRDAPREES